MILSSRFTQIQYNAFTGDMSYDNPTLIAPVPGKKFHGRLFSSLILNKIVLIET
jgi:hypothetical protein